LRLLWGSTLFVLGLLCWIGQSISWLSPELASRLGLTEVEEDVEPVYWVDIRAEAPWDALTTWTLPVAGLLLTLDVGAWSYFGLVGGGIYVYFGGRGIFQRLAMTRRGLSVGSEQSVRLAYLFLGAWSLAGLLTIALAVSDLRVP
jgi:hypothetical protein